MKNTANTIGERIKAAREAEGLSQAQLAEKLGFKSATAISLIESNERGVPSSLLQEISKVLHRETGYFLGQDEKAPIDVQVALRADKDLTPEDKEAISRFIELAKSKKHGK